MIKLQEGELLDLLPSSLKNDTDMICLSYALKMAVKRLLVYERSAMTQNFVDNIPEKILDVLAVELRAPYYHEGIGIEAKRNIVKRTLAWHAKAGTPGAVEELIRAVFGEGHIVEWFNYKGPPFTLGTFDIVTNAVLTPDMHSVFNAMIGRVKNARSWIRAIKIHRCISCAVYPGAGQCARYRPAAILDGYSTAGAAVCTSYLGASLRQEIHAEAVSDNYHRGRQDVLCKYREKGGDKEDATTI